jgi:hypothetical protein
MPTYTTTEEDKKRRAIAALATVAIAVGVAFVLYTSLVWVAPDPPLPVYGVEVNFGTDLAGFGEVQSKAVANNNTSFEKAAPAKAAPVTTRSAGAENLPPEQSQSQPAERSPLPQTGEPSPEKAPVEAVTDVEQPSPPTRSKQAKTEQQQQPEQQKTTPAQKPAATLPAPDKTPEQQKQASQNQDNPRNSGQTGSAATLPGNNNGDKPGTMGDQGSPQGQLNEDALLSSSGSGGGSSLEMPGWIWTEKPNVVDASAETGTIVFEVRIDADGEVISVNTVYRSVSRAVAAVYANEVKQLSFEQRDRSVNPPMITTGKITFIITSR